MTEAEIEELESYAESIEITRAALCSLVVQRELRAPRLKRKSHRRAQQQEQTGPREQTEGVVRHRVTVHVGNAALKSAFTAHVKSLGLGSDEAAFMLFKIEVEKRWLFNLFGYDENHG
jgi:hypothetical protein